MSKATERKAEKMNEVRVLTGSEISELQEMTRIAVSFKFIAEQIKNNTVFFNRKKRWYEFFNKESRGQDIAKDFEALATILENEKNLFVGRKLGELGYKSGEKVSLNVTTGEATRFE